MFGYFLKESILENKKILLQQHSQFVLGHERTIVRDRCGGIAFLHDVFHFALALQHLGVQLLVQRLGLFANLHLDLQLLFQIGYAFPEKSNFSFQ